MESQLFGSIWEFSKQPNFLDYVPKLVELTAELIKLYEAQGRLAADPLTPSRDRLLSLPDELVGSVVRNKVCLITGGLGCVGSALAKELIRFEPKLIVILDIRDIEAGDNFSDYSGRVIFEKGSILDTSGLMKVFNTYRPQIVFHTAAERSPGIAEKQINQSVKTNIIGTWNVLSIIKDSSSVERFVFSSTGKASRYYTEEVYAATKKICEMLVDYFSKVCPEKCFSMARFTHIVDNSLMNTELAEAAKNSAFVAIHSPGKFITAQNVKEAAYLMLNALLYAEPGKSNFLLVRNLEWPVESLEVALYYIKLYRRNIPIVFIGNPKGYGEKFFRGQLDWSNPGELNLLINVYESRSKRFNSFGDIVISSIIPCDENLLTALVMGIQSSSGESETKRILVEGMKNLFIGSLEVVDKNVTLDILRWGIDPKFLDADKVKISDFGEMVPLMINSLTNSSYYAKLKAICESSYGVKGLQNGFSI